MTLHDPRTMREWYADAAAAFVDVVDRLPAACLDQPGLGEWTVRSLIGHTCASGFGTVEAYARAARELVDAGERIGLLLDGPAEYFHAALDAMTDPDLNTRNGERAGVKLGDQPLDRAHDLAKRGVALVDSLPDDDFLLTPVGAMSVPDFLSTRAFELSIHTLDIVDASGVDAPVVLTGAVRRAAAFAAALTRDDDTFALARALLGRGALPAGFTCLR